MSFTECISQNKIILMEGALGERLKREYGLTFDENVAMANLIYQEKGKIALLGQMQTSCMRELCQF